MCGENTAVSNTVVRIFGLKNMFQLPDKTLAFKTETCLVASEANSNYKFHWWPTMSGSDKLKLMLIGKIKKQMF